MRLTADKTTFDGVLRLGVVFSPAIKTLQETIVSSVSGQVPVVERHMHITLAGIGHLKPYKAEFKKVEFPPYTGPLDFEDQPRIADNGSKMSTFVYATSGTQQHLTEYTAEILKSKNVPLEEGRKFHLSLTNQTGYGPDNVAQVWSHDKPLDLSARKTANLISMRIAALRVIKAYQETMRG